MAQLNFGSIENLRRLHDWRELRQYWAEVVEPAQLGKVSAENAASPEFWQRAYAGLAKGINPFTGEDHAA